MRQILFSPSVGVVSERLIPEGADVDPGNLRGVEHLAEAPHQCTVDAHQLLMVHHVRFVEHDSDFVVVPSKRFNTATELVRDVQLVRIKKQNNSVNSLSKPLEHTSEVVSVEAMLEC
jgi:hypothetical protein